MDNIEKYTLKLFMKFEEPKIRTTEHNIGKYVSRISGIFMDGWSFLIDTKHQLALQNLLTILQS